MHFVARVLASLAIFAAHPGSAVQSQPPAAPAPPAQIPVMDGGVGKCSLLLTVISPDGKPVLGADVKVHIAYGFAGVRKLDLEAYTNSDGKLKFTGLPAKVHQPPLEFQATKDQFAGIATYDPATECEAQHDLPLAKSKAAQ